MPASATRAKLLSHRLEPFTRRLHGVEAGDPKAVHRTRVASRRLRELLPVLQIEGGTARKLSKRLRKVTRKLGKRRETDVMLQLLDELEASGRHSARALRTVRAAVKAERTPRKERRAGPASAAELERLARKLERVAKSLAGRKAGAAGRKPDAADARGWRWALDARVARRAGKLRRAIADAGTVYIAARLHAVRIAVKKLRYALELRTEAEGRKTSADLVLLKRTQDGLGRLHDLQVLVERVRRTQTDLQRPDVAAWREMDVLSASLEAACRRLHARFIKDRPALIALSDRSAAQAPVESGQARRAG